MCCKLGIIQCNYRSNVEARPNNDDNRFEQDPTGSDAIIRLGVGDDEDSPEKDVLQYSGAANPWFVIRQYYANLGPLSRSYNSDDYFGAANPWFVKAHLEQDKDDDSKLAVLSRRKGDYFGAANPWFVSQHLADRTSMVDQDVAFPKSRLAVESRPSGISVTQARNELLQLQYEKGTTP